MADFGAAELDSFRAEAREWLEANFPPSLRRGREAAVDPEAAERPTADAELWRRRMGEKGWGVPTWPTEYGGGGLSPAEARVLRDEMERIALPTRSAAWASACSGRRCWNTATTRRCAATSRRS
jgi:alkylation response protein AidB-like acyl-CoA dehydrogenase